MEYPWARLCTFVVLTGSDVGLVVYQRLVQGKQTKVGYMAHLGGAVAGLLVGINVLRNLKQRRWEKVVWWLSLTLYLLLMAVTVVWNIVGIDRHFPAARYGNVTELPFV